MKNELQNELLELSKNVSVEKRNEVQNVLNHVFNGVSKMREQLETIVIQDENDKTNMKLANTIRLGVRQVRIEAEKTFDAKRAEVQAQMLSYKTEDQLWLKAKQTMQILTKEIEENARWKEETRQRFEAEQKELKIQQRIIQVLKVAPEIQRSEFENMSDESFAIFYVGIEKQYNDRIEMELKAEQERIERERISKLHNERREILIKVWDFVEDKNMNFGEITEERFKTIHLVAGKAKSDYEAKQNQIRIENERLKAEAAAIKKAKEKLEAELKAKAEAQQKAKIEAEAKAIAELKAKQDAEKKAKKAPDKAKLTDFANMLDELDFPELKSEEAIKILNDTKILLKKICLYIREKTSKI